MVTVEDCHLGDFQVLTFVRLLCIHCMHFVHFPQGGDLVSTMPGCVCRKVKDMGPFLASSELNK